MATHFTVLAWTKSWTQSGYGKFHIIIFSWVGDVYLALAFYGYCCICTLYNSDLYNIGAQEISAEWVNITFGYLIMYSSPLLFL